jgi:hypothetical protein
MRWPPRPEGWSRPAGRCAWSPRCSPAPPHVGNDSGLSHLAAAQGCPAVSIGLADRYYTPWHGYGVFGAFGDLQAADVLAFLHEHDLVATAPSRLVHAGREPKANVHDV